MTSALHNRQLGFLHKFKDQLHHLYLCGPCCHFPPFYKIYWLDLKVVLCCGAAPASLDISQWNAAPFQPVFMCSHLSSA